MKRSWIIIAALLLILGVSACSTGTPSPGNPEGLPTLTYSPPPTKTLPAPIPTATITPVPTDVPTPNPSPTILPPSPTPLTCWQLGGTIEKKSIPSIWLSDTLTFRIYLPPCYQALSEQRFPVIYLLHGQTFTEDQWDRLGADEIADAGIAAGQLPAFILVMPLDADDTTPPPENRFGDAIIHELIPTIDREYRTLADRQFRAIGGISRGGNWAVHLGLQYWGFFGAIGAHSTPTFSSDGPRVIKEWLDRIPPQELPRIFMDSGEDDIWLNYTFRFEELLNQENIPHEWHLFPGEHDEAYWAAHMKQYIYWYAQDW